MLQVVRRVRDELVCFLHKRGDGRREGRGENGEHHHRNDRDRGPSR